MPLLPCTSRLTSTLAATSGRSCRSPTCSSYRLFRACSTTPTNINHLVNLVHSRTYRHTHRQLVLFGHSAIRDLQLSRPNLQLLATFGASDHPPLLSPEIPHTSISPTTAQRIARTASPTSDLLALVTFPTFVPTPANPPSLTSWITTHCPTTRHPPKLLVLNGLADPGNVGTLFRTAAAFQFTCIVLLAAGNANVVDPFNAKAVRASKGTVLTLPWVGASRGWAEVGEWVKECGGGRGACASKRPQVWVAEPPRSALATIPDIESDSGIGPMVLVLSGEAAGLDANPVPVEQLQSAGAIVKSVSIPMPGGVSESLNVASAGAVLMWEMSRLKVGFS